MQPFTFHPDLIEHTLAPREIEPPVEVEPCHVWSGADRGNCERKGGKFGLRFRGKEFRLTIGEHKIRTCAR